jgi:hypothetical protein
LTRARDVATQGGLVLLNETDLSAASSISIDNLVVGNRYRVMVNVISSVDGSTLQFYFRQSGADFTSGYYGGSHYWNYLGSGGNYLSDNNNGSGRLSNLSNSTTAFCGVSFDVYLHSATIASVTGHSWSPYGGSYTTYFAKSNSGLTSVSGIKLFSSSGTLTGKSSFYEYK